MAGDPMYHLSYMKCSFCPETFEGAGHSTHEADKDAGEKLHAHLMAAHQQGSVWAALTVAFTMVYKRDEVPQEEYQPA